MPELHGRALIESRFGRVGTGLDLLVINEAEAKTVQYIFRRYTELKSVRLLKADLDGQGIVSKSRKAARTD